MPGFCKYCIIHNIDEDSIINAAVNMNYTFVKQDDYVFRQMDDSDKFYGVISGKISIQTETYQYVDEVKDGVKPGKSKRVTVNLRIPRNTAETCKLAENMILVLGEGSCFGEWGLVNEAKRSASAKALEDTYLFYLEKKDFKLTLYQCYAKLITDRKSFIRNTLVPFKNEAVYEKYSSAITPLVIIYNKVSRKGKYSLFRKHTM